MNYLVLAAVTRRKRVPLVWTLLPHGGGSASADRIALMRRYLALFSVSSIRLLLGDRELVGAYARRWQIECLFAEAKTQLASTWRTPASPIRASSTC